MNPMRNSVNDGTFQAPADVGGVNAISDSNLYITYNYTGFYHSSERYIIYFQFSVGLNPNKSFLSVSRSLFLLQFLDVIVVE